MKKYKEAYIVLATQRSGSTLLCSDMRKTKKMGSPSEHYIVLKQGDFSMSELLEKGSINNEVFGMKLMSNYIDGFSSWILGEEFKRNNNLSDRLRTSEATLNFFSENFTKVNIIQLTREEYFEQALSRLLAKKSNSWHENNKGKKNNRGELLSDDFITRKRLELCENLDCALITKEINKIVNENHYLNKLRLLSVKYNNIDWSTVTYSEVVSNGDGVLSEFLGENVSVERELKKITSSKQLEVAKNNYLSWLRL